MASGYQGLAPCVHCGFCLPACPTYEATGDEADGPRGRIVLMQGLAAGTLRSTDPAVTTHLDRCLGCRACEPVCPSGVRYGEGLEAARADIARARGTPLLARIVLAVVANPALRRVVFAGVRLMRPLARVFAGRSRLGFALGLLAGSSGRRQRVYASSRPRRHGCSLFLGCIQRELFAHVHDATRVALGVNGYHLAEPEAQGCCGALHAHAGHHDEAVALARDNVEAFRHTQGPVVVNSAGCGAMLRQYGDLLGTDEARAFAGRVRDVTEVLADAGPVRGAPVRRRVAYDAPCHLVHAQGVADAPRAVLAAIPELEIIPHAGADRCCGSAGLYALLEPAMSRDVLRPKLGHLAHVDADVVATGNPGCQMQIAAGLRAAGLDVAVCHPVELLAASYRTQGLHSPP